VNKFFTNYKKAWEEQLGRNQSELQKENQELKAENAQLRKALGFYADDESGTDDCEVARKALKGGE